MEKRIKYICYYDLPDASVRRGYVLAATNKLNYIWRVFNRIGFSVEIVSVSACIDNKIQYAHGVRKDLGNGNTLRLFPGLGGPKVIRVLGRYWLWICFIFWFLANVRRKERVFVYHSLGYCRIMPILKWLTGCILIGEIEEIYQDVSPQIKSKCKSEYVFFEACDAYIFPTQLLDQKLNPRGKPCVLIHGIYECEARRNVKWDDQDYHIVYAGTFDPNKGGALAAIATANYLPQNYHIHICGFGSDKEIEAICKLIDEVNASSKAKVSYEGLLRGEEFICFLQKCHIGLSTQNPEAAFNATSFPSKILTYLANGLQVVTIRIPVVESSGVGQCVNYYDVQDPKEIAHSIVGIHSGESPKEILKQLDSCFENDLQQLLK